MMMVHDEKLLDSWCRSFGEPLVARGPNDKISEALVVRERENPQKDGSPLEAAVDGPKRKLLRADGYLSTLSNPHLTQPTEQESIASERTVLCECSTRLQRNGKKGGR